MLGLRFDRLVHAALAGGGLTLSACPGGGQDTDGETDTDTDTTGTDSDEPTTTVTPTTEPPPPPPPPADITPPALIGIELLEPQILRLSFTEAIAPVDLVNPKRLRISLGRFYENPYYGYARTYYNNPDFLNHNSYCYEKCYYDVCYEQCYDGPPLELDILDLLAEAYQPSQVIVLLEQPVTPSLCQIISDLDSNPNGDAALLLHYADGGASQITDLAGLPLAQTGSTWVKMANQDYLMVEGQQFPEQNPFLPIPCPF